MVFKIRNTITSYIYLHEYKKEPIMGRKKKFDWGPSIVLILKAVSC